jgi:Family of unknown function (DUF6167)
MRRVFWFTLGVGAGSWATYRITRLAHGWTPRGLSTRAIGIGERLRTYAVEIRTEARAREIELRDVLGLANAGPPRAELRGPRARIHGRVLDDDKDGH